MNFACFIFSFLGIWALTAQQLKKKLLPELGEDNAPFLFLLTWFGTLGIFGLVSSFNFYFDIAVSYTRLILLLIGVWGLSKYRRNLLIEFKNLLSKLGPAPRGIEKFYLILIALFLANYLYRSFIPWFDQDEISQYGYFSKLIARNWRFSELFSYMNDGNMKFAESLYAQLFFVFKSTLFIRFFKFLNLIGLLGLTYFFLLHVSTIRKNALLALCLFLGTPELSYLATSLKVDSTTMTFEWCAFLLVLLAFFKKSSSSRLPKNFLMTLALACTFTYMATATRPSGIYSACLMTSIFIATLIASKKMNWVAVLLVFISALCYAHPYLLHIAKLGNPLFPFQAPWPFDQGLYQLTIKDWKGFCNIPQFLPFPFYQAYLIFHVGLGFETSLFNFLSFIPHASSRGVSIGQLTPCLLLIFAAPFFWKKDRLIFYVSLLFLPLFTAWSLGVQLTRVLLATGQLTILFSVRMGTWVTRGLTALAVLLLSYQTLYSLMKYPHSPLSAFSTELRYESNRRILEGYKSPLTYYDGLNHHQHEPDLPRLLLSYEEVSRIEAVLAQIPSAKILVLDALFYGLHIYFSNGLFVQAQSLPEGKFKLQLPLLQFGQKPSEENFDCVLRAAATVAPALPLFSEMMFKNSNIELLCQKRHD